MTDDLGLTDLFASHQAAEDEASGIYDRLKQIGKLSGHRVVTYRCSQRRCLLLDVIQTPVGVICHSPRYRLSPTVNLELSSEEGRQANTEDGNRLWKAATFRREAASNLELNCDHLRTVVLADQDLDDDIARRAGVILLGQSGTRV